MKLRQVKPEEHKIRSALLSDLQAKLKGWRKEHTGKQVAELRKFSKGGEVAPEDKDDKKPVEEPTEVPQHEDDPEAEAEAEEQEDDVPADEPADGEEFSDNEKADAAPEDLEALIASLSGRKR